MFLVLNGAFFFPQMVNKPYTHDPLMDLFNDFQRMYFSSEVKKSVSFSDTFGQTFKNFLKKLHFSVHGNNECNIDQINYALSEKSFQYKNCVLKK